MCGEVVAAPLSLQDTVYPILRKKSLPFCEKSKKFLKLCTAVRKKYKTKRLRTRTNSLRQNLSVLPAPSGREPLAWRESLRLNREVGTIGNALRYALRINSGIRFFIRDSEKPAGFSESPFHRRGRGGKRQVQRRFLRKRGAAGERSLPRGELSRSD